jgi:hypothetical protein
VQQSRSPLGEREHTLKGADKGALVAQNFLWFVLSLSLR